MQLRAIAFSAVCTDARENLMAKLLTLFSRIAVMLLGASFLAALVVSILSTSRFSSLPLGATKVDAISSSSWPDHPEDKTSCYLIDRDSCRCDVVPLAAGNHWGQLSVSVEGSAVFRQC